MPTTRQRVPSQTAEHVNRRILRHIEQNVRYYAQLQDQPILPLTERRYGQFVGQPGFPSDGTIPSEKRGWQPRLGISWDPQGDAKTEQVRQVTLIQDM